MTFNEAIEYINSVSWKGSRPGLGRTRELLALMGNPEKKLKCIHIVGTNGKGSTAAMTAEILKKAGYKVGLFTSPSLYKFNERMKINGSDIKDEEIAEIIEYIKPLSDSMEDSPTEFELVTCLAFQYFYQNKCDIAVLEAGMGGALDSTNVIEVPEVAVMTNIGLDHVKFLGDTIEKIAETKAGIIKEGGDVVIYRNPPEAEKVIERICKENNARLIKADFDSLKSVSCSLEGQVFDCGERKNIFLSLLGVHQIKNASVVLSIIDLLKEKGWKIGEENIRDGMRDVYWSGRFEIVRKNPMFIIDGGHNPQCIDALSENIKTYLPDKKLVILTGVLADKDFESMYNPVLSFAKEFICIEPPNERKLEAHKLAEALRNKGLKAEGFKNISDGVKKAVERAGKEGTVLCFGSLYMINDVRKALDNL